MTASDTAGLAGWLTARRRASALAHRSVDLADSRAWRLVEGSIEHRTGGFFSVIGLRARSDLRALDGIEQPIILQPEIGILAFLVRRAAEDPELLVQAKVEPGNVGEAQLAPTVQATESNYRRRHGGAPTAYLEHVTGGVPSVRVLADSLQSEQGTRFLGKFNRNMTVAVAGEGPWPATDAWRWIPAEQLLTGLHRDFTVNTDARSTLICSDWRALARDGRPFARWRGGGGFGEDLLESWRADDSRAELRLAEVHGRLRERAGSVRLEVERRPLQALSGWSLRAGGLYDVEGSGFDVLHFDVRCEGREVERWDQPLVASRQPGEASLVVQRRRGVMHLLLRLSAEVGFRDRVQFGPTAAVGIPGAETGAVAAWCRGATDLITHADVSQSDEGGRFYRSVVRYRLLEAPEDAQVPEDALTLWVTLSQAQRLAQTPGCLTNESRSLLSLVLRWL